jgi:uncharacterized protein YidB (DUF937 family)
MGLFDQVVNSFTGGSSGGSQTVPVALMEMLGNHEGGLDGLLQKFNAAGLGDTVQSWVGNGENQPISGDAVQQVLGSDTIQQLAARTNLPVDQISALISEHLPNMVDGLTPNGAVGSSRADLLSAGEAMLKSRFGFG